MRPWLLDDVSPGDDWKHELGVALGSVDLALLLLSAEALASDLFRQVEFPRLLDQHIQRGLRVVPVLLRSCSWQRYPWIGNLAPLPRNRKAISASRGDVRDQVFSQVVEEIGRLVGVPARSDLLHPPPLSHLAKEQHPTHGSQESSTAIDFLTAGSADQDEEADDVDPLVSSLTPERLYKDVQEFNSVLDAQVPGSAIHEFLATHSYFFNYELRLFSLCPLYSKIRLGAQHSADFVWVDLGSYGAEWSFIVVAQADARMFTPGDEPSEALNEALQRTRDWRTWINDDASTARQRFPHIAYPMSYIFIGRRAEITPSAGKRLQQLCYEHRAHVQIRTLDRLADRALSVLGLLDQSQPYRWRVPMHALGDDAFSARKPERLWKYLAEPDHAQWLRDHHRQRMSNREYSSAPEVVYVESA